MHFLHYYAFVKCRCLEVNCGLCFFDCYWERQWIYGSFSEAALKERDYSADFLSMLKIKSHLCVSSLFSIFHRPLTATPCPSNQLWFHVKFSTALHTLPMAQSDDQSADSADRIHAEKMWKDSDVLSSGSTLLITSALFLLYPRELSSKLFVSCQNVNNFNKLSYITGEIGCLSVPSKINYIAVKKTSHMNAWVAQTLP